MKFSFRRRGVIAGIGVVSAVAIAVLGFAGPAQGASPLVDPAATGSITVHKFVQPASPTGLPANGTQVSTSGLTPIAGVGFQVRQVQGIDLTTNQGWTNASSLSASFSAANPETSITTAGYSLGSGTTKTTDASGVAAFTGLSVGLYLVKETSAPSGATPAQPVLVSVPITDPTNLNAWIYDVHIYPKNAITAGTMSVNDTGAVKLGDPVTWQVTADIPNVTTIDGYQVVDVLDTNLTYQSATVTLADGTVLNSGPADTTTTYDAPSRTLTVAFTAHGLGVLAAHPTTKVLVSIVTAANAVGTIANSALIYPNLASFNIASGQPGGPAATPSAETHWGSIVLHQKDTSGADLTGGSFQVFASASDAAARTNPVTLGGQTSFTVSNSNGQLTLTGLRYSDFANGATVAGGAAYNTYYVVQAKAPTGFELLAQPASFTVGASSTAGGTQVVVSNVRSNAGFTLPLTGGSGAGALYLAGILLLGTGIAFLLIRRRNPQTA